MRFGSYDKLHCFRDRKTQGRFRSIRRKRRGTPRLFRRVQGLGFKLSEIRGLLNLRGSRLQREHQCAVA